LRHDSSQSDHTGHHGTTACVRFAGTAFTLERPESAKLPPLIRYPLLGPGRLGPGAGLYWSEVPWFE
jgi:hypothetical protein